MYVIFATPDTPIESVNRQINAVERNLDLIIGLSKGYPVLSDNDHILYWMKRLVKLKIEKIILKHCQR